MAILTFFIACFYTGKIRYFNISSYVLYGINHVKQGGSHNHINEREDRKIVTEGKIVINSATGKIYINLYRSLG